MPNLCRAVSGDRVAAAWSVAEVLGSLSEDDLADYIRASCLEKGRAATVKDYKLPALPREKGERAKVLAKNGAQTPSVIIQPACWAGPDSGLLSETLLTL